MGSVLKPLVQILLFLFLLMGFMITVLSDSSTDPGLCANVSLNLHSCAGVLQSGSLTGFLFTECCDALKRIQDDAARLGVQQTCLCAKDCLATHILPEGVSVNATDISNQIQSSCGVDLGFDFDADGAC